jgi:D-serine deaminase-like pyridoxal phosphate-dependent protein
MSQSATPEAWYAIRDSHRLVTPGLVVYRDRVRQNLDRMISVAGDARRLWPHAKTHKMAAVTRMYAERGVRQFKCATIAEAEMLAQSGATAVLLAYQPVGPHVSRLARLAAAYPRTRLAAVVDDGHVTKDLSSAAVAANVQLDVFVDLDVGMHRTGIPADERAADLFLAVRDQRGLRARGLHAYDGHLRDPDLGVRTRQVDECFAPVLELREKLRQHVGSEPLLVAGGTPTFPVHARHEDRLCSPGTCVFWDAGYQRILPDLDFLHAALVVTRVISRPGVHRACVDLGHKAIAAENPPPRVHFLGVKQQLREVGHSEEHLVLETEDACQWRVGDLLYGVPHHICPTVALHQEATVVEDGAVVDTWPVTARSRRLTI